MQGVQKDRWAESLQENKPLQPNLGGESEKPQTPAVLALASKPRDITNIPDACILGNLHHPHCPDVRARKGRGAVVQVDQCKRSSQHLSDTWAKGASKLPERPNRSEATCWKRPRLSPPWKVFSQPNSQVFHLSRGANLTTANRDGRVQGAPSDQSSGRAKADQDSWI